MRVDRSQLGWAPVLGMLLALAAFWPARAEVAVDDRVASAAVDRIDAALGTDTISVRLRVADGYYLFANTLRVESTDAGIEIGEPTLPPAERFRDPFFGEVDVYRGIVELDLPHRGGGRSRIPLAIHGQGCNSEGECNPVLIEGEATADDSPTAPTGLAKAAPALARLLALGGSIEIGGSGGDEFLDPDVAFVLNAVAVGPDTIEARWDIAEGYYLYRDKFRFRTAQGSSAALGEAGFPKGKVKDDEYFGPMEVYYDSVAALVPVARASPGTALDVDITYQGCAEAGLCYPPITKTVSLLVPSAMAATGSGTSGSFRVPGLQARAGEVVAPLELPEQDRVAAALVSGNRWLVILSLFGAGLLLTFTPCVLPMVPILASLVVGQGTGRGTGQAGEVSSRRAFMLSLVYVLAMALTYTGAGVVAGLFGANLAATFQNPWIVSAFALVFVLLSLSMFGFYELQVPASWQTKLAALSHRQRGGTYAGVAVMGALSALIVGPCVAAPLAGVLIYIGQTGDPILGGLALFALGMGMGVPLMVAGVSAGRLLPRAGAWMNAVKAVFGVMLLAVAIYLLERVAPDRVGLALWAALLIVCSIYLGALDSMTVESGGWRRLWKGTGLVMLVYGVLVMVGAVAGQGDLLRPLRGLTLAGGAAAEHELAFRTVKGVDGLKSELEPAAVRGQVVMFDYYADWCISCKEMERFTFSDPSVQAVLSDVVLLQTDVTANDAADRALLAEFDLFGPPAILFFGADGRERRELRVVGFMDADDFLRVLERAVAPAGAVSASRGVPPIRS